MGMTFLMLTLAAILASYTFVLIAVLHMSSGERQQKALITWSSHLTVVGMYYGAAMFMYIWPNSYHSPKRTSSLYFILSLLQYRTLLSVA